MTADAAGNMHALMEHVAKALVDTPDQVAIEPVDEDGTVVLELKVASNDLGKVIGKQGRTARAMRTLLSAAAARSNRRYTLEILE
jgi:uncharacterized protein